MTSYPIHDDRSIRNWLAYTPTPISLTTLSEYVPEDGSPYGEGNRWIMNYWAFDPNVTGFKQRLYESLRPPVEISTARPVLHQAVKENRRWEYAVALEDQVVDFSRFNLNPAIMQGWLYAGVMASQAMTVQAELISIGPARAFVNQKEAIHFDERFQYVANQFIPVTLELRAGMNDLHIYGLMFGWREARLAIGLRFVDDVPLEIEIPLGDVDADKWRRAENGLAMLHVKQFAFPTLPGYLHVDDKLAEPFEFSAEVTLAVPDLPWANLEKLPIPVEWRTYIAHAGEKLELPITEAILSSISTTPGENTLRLTLRPSDGTPIEREIEIIASQNTFSVNPYGDYESRHAEALAHLARIPFDVMASIAAVTTGAADTISSDAIGLACEFMERRYDCADFYSTSLLWALNRFADTIALTAEDQQKIEETFRRFKFWIDEPGIDGMCYFTENHQILFHTTAYLTGQRWPDWTFSNSGWTGAHQMERTKPRIVSWITRRLSGGFSEWDSNAYLAMDIFAMLTLVEFAEDEQIVQLATMMLHKIFFMIACQSFRGAHGSTHGRCYVAGLKSARFENTSGVQRIAWGMGIFNGETRATGALALSRKYRVPDVIQRIGADVDATIVTRARSKAPFVPESDMYGGEWDVSTITFRTPHVMLAAAMDYHPGGRGIQEHLWQATLGPEAMVFTTYPGNSQLHGSARPNYWSGSARLPRVAMHDQTVMCLYRREANVGLDFTHAYFPAAMFDEVVIQGQWAYARVGKGYVALWGDGDLMLMDSGDEIRSSGAGLAWMCHVGSGGDFAEFIASLNDPQSDGASLRWTAPTGEDISFAWDDPPHIFDDFPHYENRYTNTPLDSQQMTIQHGGESLHLDWSPFAA